MLSPLYLLTSGPTSPYVPSEARQWPDLLQVVRIMARESNLGLLGGDGEPAPYLSAT